MFGGEAVRIGHTTPDDVKLLRLEFPDYTFVWSRRPDLGVNEAGLLCGSHDAEMTAGFIGATATPTVAVQAHDLLNRAAVVTQTVSSGAPPLQG